MGIYLPNTVSSENFLVLEPWWYIRTMVVAPERLNWLDLELRRQTYISEHNWKRVASLEILAFLIFFFGNLGMRFFGLFVLVRSRKYFFNIFGLFFATILLVSFGFPMLFLQKGVAYNTIQFYQFFLLFFGWLAGVGVWQLLEKRSKAFKVILAIIIIALMVPTQLGLLWQFYSNNALAKVNDIEFNALQFLSEHSQPGDVILTAPFNKYQSYNGQPPTPISVWSDSSYVSAITSRQTVLSDEEQLTILGYDITKVSDQRKAAFASQQPADLLKFIQDYHVDYLYLAPTQVLAFSVDDLAGKIIYADKGSIIVDFKNR